MVEETDNYKYELDDYRLYHFLGSGAFSKVYLGKKIGSDIQYAIKYARFEGDEDEDEDESLNLTQSMEEVKALVESEITIMKNIHHENIIQLFDFKCPGKLKKKNSTVVHDVMYMVLELAPAGELHNYVMKRRGGLADEYSRYYFLQALKALEFLHSNGYCHRDIKLNNFVLDSQYKLKITDFGFSRPMSGKDGEGNLFTKKGTPGFMAPEIETGEGYQGKSVDVFSTGVTLFWMGNGKKPFINASIKDKFYKLLCTNQQASFWKIHQVKGRDDFKNLIERMLDQNPSTRITIPEIFAHPWVQKPYAAIDNIIEKFSTYHKMIDNTTKTAPSQDLISNLQFRDIGNEEAVDSRKLLPYSHEHFQMSQIFSYLPKEAIHEIAIEYLKEEKFNIIEDKEFMKFRFEKKGELTGEFSIFDYNDHYLCVDIVKLKGLPYAFDDVYCYLREKIDCLKHIQLEEDEEEEEEEGFDSDDEDES